MNVDVAVDGRPWKVSVEPAEGPNQVTVGVKGKKRVIDVAWVDAGTLSLIDGPAAHEIRIAPDDTGALQVTLGSRTFDVVATPRARPQTARANPEPAVQSPEPARQPRRAVVKAPMPGRIVRVFVAAGDRVVAKQPLVVVEAMKMENELRAPRDGVVAEVNAVAGTAVEAGTVLVLIE